MVREKGCWVLRLMMIGVISVTLLILQVFYDVTMQISGSLHSTSNLYFDVLCSVYLCLTEYSESSDPLLNTMANKMKVKYFFLISKRNIIKKRKAQSSTQEVYKKGI